MKMTKILSILILLLFSVTFSQKMTLKEKVVNRNIVIPEMKTFDLDIDCFTEATGELKKEQEKQNFLISVLDNKKDKEGYMILDSIIIK